MSEKSHSKTTITNKEVTCPHCGKTHLVEFVKIEEESQKVYTNIERVYDTRIDCCI